MARGSWLVACGSVPWDLLMRSWDQWTFHFLLSTHYYLFRPLHTVCFHNTALPCHHQTICFFLNLFFLPLCLICMTIWLLLPFSLHCILNFIIAVGYMKIWRKYVYIYSLCDYVCMNIVPEIQAVYRKCRCITGQSMWDSFTFFKETLSVKLSDVNPPKKGHELL